MARARGLGFYPSGLRIKNCLISKQVPRTTTTGLLFLANFLSISAPVRLKPRIYFVANALADRSGNVPKDAACKLTRCLAG